MVSSVKNAGRLSQTCYKKFIVMLPYCTSIMIIKDQDTQKSQKHKLLNLCQHFVNMHQESVHPDKGDVLKVPIP